MKTFKENKNELVNDGVYKNAIHTDYTDTTIYISIPYGSLKNSGVTKKYKVPHDLNLKRIANFWHNSIDKSKELTY